MVELRKMSLDEVKKYPAIVDQVISMYGEITDDFYEYEFNDMKKILYRADSYFSILCMEGEYVLCSSFCLDEDYNLAYMEFGEFCASKSEDVDVIWEVGSGIVQKLYNNKRTEGTINGPFDGLVSYSQINEAANEGLVITYEVCYRENKKLHSGIMREPFLYSYVRGNKITNYTSLKADKDLLAYDIITIKEYGLRRYLDEGAYSLQKENMINRYFRVWFRFSDGTPITLYPLSRPYTNIEMRTMLQERGFKVDIPEYLLDYYNGEYEEQGEYAELAVAVQNYDKNVEDEMKLQKK